MRSFIISVAILIITVSFVAVNAAVFARKTDEIGAVLYSLPSSADTHTESEDALVNLIALESFIERNENYFQILSRVTSFASSAPPPSTAQNTTVPATIRRTLRRSSPQSSASSF